MRRLVLVRHAQVDVRADVPATEWRLTREGLEAAAALARSPLFAGVRVLASSPEPKAHGTALPIAARLGFPVRVERDLRESERPELPILPREEHESLVARYLGGEELAGWEPLDAVRARLRGVAARLLAGHDGDVALVSHGRALAILLGLSPREWAAIPLPAVAVADARTLRLAEPFA